MNSAGAVNARRNAKIAEMIAANMSYGAIAARVGCSRSTVAGVAHRAKVSRFDGLDGGLKMTRGEREKAVARLVAGEPAARIAADYGCTSGNIRTLANQRGWRCVKRWERQS